MDVFVALIIIVGVAIIALSSWEIHCSGKAVKQRRAIIGSISPNAWNTDELLADYDEVSLKNHIHELMWFRDPMNLYSDELLAVVQEKARHHET